MKRVMYFALFAAGAYFLYQMAQKYKAAQLPPVSAATPLPSNAQLTGRVVQTNNNRPPGPGSSEVVGYGIHSWAEYQLPDGSGGWVVLQG